mmetsp:Transcript_19871/g.43004  ORF Transcript_19871/g.43004 Transcript_19871/m.43004 type:complete len:242 (+) Transcript_19871:305-1030(+)
MLATAVLPSTLPLISARHPTTYCSKIVCLVQLADSPQQRDQLTWPHPERPSSMSLSPTNLTSRREIVVQHGPRYPPPRTKMTPMKDSYYRELWEMTPASPRALQMTRRVVRQWTYWGYWSHQRSREARLVTGPLRRARAQKSPPSPSGAASPLATWTHSLQPSVALINPRRHPRLKMQRRRYSPTLAHRSANHQRTSSPSMIHPRRSNLRMRWVTRLGTGRRLHSTNASKRHCWGPTLETI